MAVLGEYIDQISRTQGMPFNYPATYENIVAIYGIEEENLEQMFSMRLAALQDEEIRRGVKLTGPHRDDVRFCSGGRDLKKFGSQGQKRLLAVLLKLAELFHPDIFRLVYYKTGSRMDAEDITQEIFIKMVKYLHRLKKPDKFKSWIYSIAYNHVRDYYRKQKMLGVFGLNSSTDDFNPEDRNSDGPDEDIIKKEGADRVTYERYLKLVAEYAPPDMMERFKDK